jgi:two-component system cell cycle response regulator DivK
MKRVLIIEDNEDNMKLISFILENHGFYTLKAASGQEGIDMVLHEKPDLVLLDIQLPDMDGLEVLRAIRALEANDDLPVIAVTSYAMSGDRERLLAAGCNGYIEKPINPDTIIAEIRRFTGEQP